MLLNNSCFRNSILFDYKCLQLETLHKIEQRFGGFSDIRRGREVVATEYETYVLRSHGEGGCQFSYEVSFYFLKQLFGGSLLCILIGQ